MKTKTSPSRLSVSFDPRSAERLERLSGDEQGKAEVIRDALELEDLYREAVSGGGKLIVQRPDGSIAEVLRPSGPWGSTGRALPEAAGAFTLPPGTNGERDRRELLARIIAVLYSCVGSAQQASANQNAVVNAVQQMVLANAALAVGEADAFLTLLSAGIEGPACIHLRAIGEQAIRIAFCREHPDGALALYQSWPASWQKLVEKQLAFDFPAMQQGQRTMQALEKQQQPARKVIAERDHLLNDMEWTMWSKRAHGDIYALVQVATNLATRGADIRTPIIREVPFGLMGDILLSRAIGFSLMVLKHLIETFKINVPGAVVDDLLVKYATLQNRDTQEQAARSTIGRVVLDSYVAKVGGTETEPVFCAHDHVSPESAATTCLPGVAGNTYEVRNGALTKFFWQNEARPKPDGKRHFVGFKDCPYVGKPIAQFERQYT